MQRLHSLCFISPSTHSTGDWVRSFSASSVRYFSRFFHSTQTLFHSFWRLFLSNSYLIYNNLRSSNSASTSERQYCDFLQCQVSFLHRQTLQSSILNSRSTQFTSVIILLQLKKDRKNGLK